MTDPKPLTRDEIAEFKDWLTNELGFYQDRPVVLGTMACRLLATLDQRDAIVAAAQDVVDDVLLAGAIESRFGANAPQPSSTTAKLMRLREALAATEKEPSDAGC